MALPAGFRGVWLPLWLVGGFQKGPACWGCGLARARKCPCSCLRNSRFWGKALAGRTSQSALFRLQRELGSAGVGQTLPWARSETREGCVEEQSRANLGFVCWNCLLSRVLSFACGLEKSHQHCGRTFLFSSWKISLRACKQNRWNSPFLSTCFRGSLGSQILKAHAGNWRTCLWEPLLKGEELESAVHPWRAGGLNQNWI